MKASLLRISIRQPAEDLLLHNNIRYRQIEAREEMYNAMTPARLML